MSKKYVTVYWLVPAAPERQLFRELIAILAGQFDAPRFEPHLSLGIVHGRVGPKEILNQVKSGPLRLRIKGMDYSPKFTKTLFVKFISSAALGRLVFAVQGRHKSLRDPHLSLLYKSLESGVKKELARTIKLPFRTVVFDSIKAVRCPSPTTTRTDVQSWRVLASKKLSR